MIKQFNHIKPSFYISKNALLQVCEDMDDPCRHAMADRARRGHAGFTLFEVAISMLLVSLSVISVLMIFPVGLRQQQTVRYQILAATRALQLIDSFAGRSSVERVADFELPRPWEGSGFCYSNTRWDLETHMTRWDAGIIPLPVEIARRLDVDGDEIQRILDAGGAIYYADPGSIPSIDYKYHNPAPPNEAQKLVFAVTGLAQHNAITVFPYKAAPYRAAYPSPPGYMSMNGNQFLPKERHTAKGIFTSDVDLIEGWSNGDPGDGRLPPRDPAMAELFKAFETYYGNPNGIGKPNGDEASIKLVKAALAFCKDKFELGQITGAVRLGGLAPADEYATYITVQQSAAKGPENYEALGQAYDDAFAALCRQAESSPIVRGDEGDLKRLAARKARMRAEIALRVQCFRFLAQAMATFNQVSSKSGNNSAIGIRNTLAQIPPIDGLQISDKLLRYYHDRSLATAMRYAASFPYDWGAPRPLNRAIMMDQPLMEWDLFSPPHAGLINGTTINAAMWRPLSAQAVTSPGLPAMYPGAMVGNAFQNGESPFPAWHDRGPNRLWGDARHFTLTRAFAPHERCRQIVFWSVDWHAYEDAETAPSAPVDASRAPIRCLNRNDAPGRYRSRCFTGRNAGRDEDALYIGNPERPLAFIQEVRQLDTGSSVSEFLMRNKAAGKDVKPEVFTGAYGADRNHNYTLDRGPIGPTQRLRALPVARFNYYDPRIPIVTR